MHILEFMHHMLHRSQTVGTQRKVHFIARKVLLTLKYIMLAERDKQKADYKKNLSDEEKEITSVDHF